MKKNIEIKRDSNNKNMFEIVLINDTEETIIAKEAEEEPPCALDDWGCIPDICIIDYD